jgi:hypothetical protein
MIQGRNRAAMEARVARGGLEAPGFGKAEAVPVGSLFSRFRADGLW